MNWRHWLLVSLSVGIVLSGTLGGYFWHLSRSPASGVMNGEPARILIPRGTVFSEVTEQLREQDMLAHPKLYTFLAYWMDAPVRLQVGEFELPRHFSTGQVLEELITGKGVLRKVTIPEGKTLREIAQRLESAGLASAKDLVALEKDPELLDQTGISEATSLEGFLFPETYFLSKAFSPRELLEVMISHYRNIMTDSMRERAQELNLTEYQLLTLASIVEKETANPRDRDKISAVFHNRLRKRMRLDSDPTVIYGIPNFDGNLTRKHLRKNHPHNTYTNHGLPPTPISNPGVDALMATLYPAEVKYLYFVARGDGSSHFSKTLREHNRAVAYYQKSRRNRKLMQENKLKLLRQDT
ncbi:MAG: endolytic transglycosylase MltG [bacterium]|jgi:UPF0755 protein